ncbi:MAG TPA: CoA-binding protein [Chroococcidiopsis sp.]
MDFTANSKVLVQGITESIGSIYVPRMLEYGTQIVAGVCPGHGGSEQHGVPVFDMVDQALAKVGAIDTTVILVPPYQALDASLEAIAAGIPKIILITEGVPPLDMVRLIRKAEATDTLIVGPDSPGIIVPGQILLGTHPVDAYSPGDIGLISRSGTLTYEVAHELTKAGFGQSIAVGIGGDRIVGSSFQQWLQILEEDDRTEAIVLVGEIGGDSEEVAAQYIGEAIDKPVIAFVAGRTVPRGRNLGHASAIIASQIAELGSDLGTADNKIAAFKRVGVPVAERPSQIPGLLKQALQENSRNSA